MSPYLTILTNFRFKLYFATSTNVQSVINELINNIFPLNICETKLENNVNDHPYSFLSSLINNTTKKYLYYPRINATSNQVNKKLYLLIIALRSTRNRYQVIGKKTVENIFQLVNKRYDKKMYTCSYDYSKPVFDNLK